MDLREAHHLLLDFLHQVSSSFQKLPGSAILLRYVRSSYQNDPVRSAVELFLFLFFIRYLLAPSYSPRAKGGTHVALAEEEIDDLVDEWTPEPLVAPLTEFEEAENEKRPVVVGPTGPKTKLTNGRVVTNLASYNFYNLIANENLKEKAVQTLRTYGVGPCGPPNFYGTQDVHMRTEANIAAFLGTPACIIYAQAFSTISSVIPAFSKRGDMIVADKAVNYAARKGIQISRSTVRWYEHNDMDDLERVLQSVVKEEAHKPLTRRFIVTEALFENVGDEVELGRVIDLKFKYKFRLILDETSSFGVLGATGRGITEQQNVDAADTDMIVGSLAGSLCAGGGFCAGSEVVIDHLRINSAAYTYSAGLPAMLATAASEGLILLQTDRDLIAQLRANIRAMRAQLDPRSEWVYCTSSVNNPVLLLSLKPEVVTSKGLGVEEQERLLQDIVDECMNNNVLICRLKRMPRTGSTSSSLTAAASSATRRRRHGGDAAAAAAAAADWQPAPALKVCVTVGLSRKEIERAGITVRHAVTKIVSRRK